MNAEKITQPQEIAPGVIREVPYWIAYPDHVQMYADVSARIKHAYGYGRTKSEALRDARTRYTPGQEP